MVAGLGVPIFRVFTVHVNKIQKNFSGSNMPGTMNAGSSQR